MSDNNNYLISINNNNIYFWPFHPTPFTLLQLICQDTSGEKWCGLLHLQLCGMGCCTSSFEPSASLSACYQSAHQWTEKCSMAWILFSIIYRTFLITGEIKKSVSEKKKKMKELFGLQTALRNNFSYWLKLKLLLKSIRKWAPFGKQEGEMIELKLFLFVVIWFSAWSLNAAAQNNVSLFNSSIRLPCGNQMEICWD